MKLNSLLPLTLFVTLAYSLAGSMDAVRLMRRANTDGCSNDCEQAAVYLEKHCVGSDTDYTDANYFNCICNIDDNSFWSNLAGCYCGDDVPGESLDATDLHSTYCLDAVYYSSYFEYYSDYTADYSADASGLGGIGGIGGFGGFSDFDTFETGDETGASETGASETGAAETGSVGAASASVSASPGAGSGSGSVSPSSQANSSPPKSTAAPESSASVKASEASSEKSSASAKAGSSSASAASSSTSHTSSAMGNTLSIGALLYLIFMCLL